MQHSKSGMSIFQKSPQISGEPLPKISENLSPKSRRTSPQNLGEPLPKISENLSPKSRRCLNSAFPKLLQKKYPNPEKYIVQKQFLKIIEKIIFKNVDL